MSWRDRARQIIAEQEQAHPELQGDALRKHCSKNYPFAQRRGFAYKAWLAAMRERFGDRGAPARAERDGQELLF